MQHITASFSTLLFALMITPIIRTFARRINMVAMPREDRWHKKPTALLGGAAIYLAFTVGYLALAPKPQNPAGVYSILAAASLLFFTGLIDDFIQIKPYTKLIVQLTAAATVVYFGIHLPWTNYAALNMVITVFWLVGITNAINLLDNMDGLAGGISL